jgi:hypothetical protein
MGMRLQHNFKHDNLIIDQVVNKFSAFYGTQMFISVPTTARQRSRFLHPTRSETTFSRCIWTSFLPDRLPKENSVCISYLSHEFYTLRSFHPQPNNIWWRQTIKTLNMQFHPPSRHFTPPRSKYPLRPTQKKTATSLHNVLQTPFFCCCDGIGLSMCGSGA